MLGLPARWICFALCVCECVCGTERIRVIQQSSLLAASVIINGPPMSTLLARALAEGGIEDLSVDD